MVNKCSVNRCRSLYEKDNVTVKLHRFPLSDPETLPLWIAATGKDKDWKPCKSSRMCSNHFEKSEYMIGHGKGILKIKSIPTIEYCTDDRKYHKRKSLNSSNDDGQTNKYLKINPVNEHHSESDYDNRDNFNCDEALKTEHEDFNYEKKNDVCNRKNQCYMFTSSFKEDVESISVNIDQSIANSNFSKIMALKLKKQRRTIDIYSLYFKSLKKIKNFHKQQNNLSSLKNKTVSFAAFLEAQMNDLRKNKKVYLTTKHKIQKILMKAQLEIAN